MLGQYVKYLKIFGQLKKFVYNVCTKLKRPVSRQNLMKPFINVIFFINCHNFKNKQIRIFFNAENGLSYDFDLNYA